MRALILFAIVGISTPVLGPGTQRPGRGPYTIAVDVELALFNVTVRDRRDVFVSGLDATDFQIYEDDQQQEITLFEAENRPATVGLVIDNSGSMTNKRAEVAEAALEFVRASDPDDEMFVVNFNENASLGLPASIPYTNDPDQIRYALLRTQPAGMTALYDALALGLDHLKAGTRDRKALVVLSDGGDNASEQELEEILQSATPRSATIYTIGIYDDSSDDRNPGALRKIAQLSGGRAYFPRSLDDLGQIWNDIAGGIRSQYTIGYRSSNPAHDGVFRKVKITVRRNGQNLRVTARDGYFAPAAPGAGR